MELGKGGGAVEEDPCPTQSHPSLNGDQRGGQGGPTPANKQGLYLPFLPQALSPEPTKVECFVFSFSGSAVSQSCTTPIQDLCLWPLVALGV